MRRGELIVRVRRTMLAISTAFVVSSSDMSSSCACGIGSSCEHSEQITQSLHAQDACMARFGGVSALERFFFVGSGVGELNDCTLCF